MEKFKDIVDRYGVFALWILMCLLTIAAITGCIIGMSICPFICGFGCFGSVVSLLIFVYQAWGEWIETKMT